jgi:hypothetical protein
MIQQARHSAFFSNYEITTDLKSGWSPVVVRISIFSLLCSWTVRFKLCTLSRNWSRGGRVRGFENALGFSDIFYETDNLKLLRIRACDLFKFGIMCKTLSPSKVGRVSWLRICVHRPVHHRGTWPVEGQNYTADYWTWLYVHLLYLCI